MCGLVTIHSNRSILKKRKHIINNMLNSIEHRGPDGKGVHEIEGQAIFGHCRLAIIDIENGVQPMFSNDHRYSLVFNGEIYNFLELRQELSKNGQQFNTQSDTEVLLNLLINFGASAIGKLNGMFAFVFHDSYKNEWIAARDHFGIKPLYYTKSNNDELIFASEIKAILIHPDIKAERDEVSFQQYLSFQFCLDNRTFFKNIVKVKPGYYLQGNGEKILNEVCYWDTNYQIDEDHNENWFNDQLFYLLNDSMRIQIRSDVPIGGYISGGIDSSLVCSLAGKNLVNPMPMFHGRFTEGEQYDESYYAKAAVKQANGIYHEIIPTPQQFIETLPKLIVALDEPLAGPGLFPQYMVSKLASENVKVVLGGQGGDEIFGGYARYLIGYLEQALKGSIFETQEEGKHLVTLESIIPHLSILKNYVPLLTTFWSKGLFDDMDARYFHLIDRSQGIKSKIHPETFNRFNQEELFADFQKIFNHPDTISYINKMTHFDQKTLLPALLQIEDRVSMLVSLESRVPLLDYRIVDLITSIPPSFKFKGGQTKHILRKVAKDVIPKKILNRKDKMGFPVPLSEWMDGGVVREFVIDTLLSKRSLQRGIFHSDALNAMINNQGVGGRQLWGAISLELWHQHFIDKV